jgi:protein Mpv17
MTMARFIQALLLALLASSCSSFSTIPSDSRQMLLPTYQKNDNAVGSSYRQSHLKDATISAVESFFITNPYLAAFLTCSAKASAADFIAQTKASASNVDLSRNAAFLVYGGLYQGMAQQFMYSTVFPGMFGHDLDLYGLISQVAFDMTVVGPFLCLPLAYAVKGMFIGNDNVETGLQKYVHDVSSQGLLFKYWALWTPVNFLTFGIIPLHFRVAFVAFISFFWIFILSSTAAAESPNESHESASSNGISSTATQQSL